ncbi:hypothetical protein C5748_17070 [Phyllobacterium phragmitis]|uniref:HK97 gp10 family phage protein n=1 Tax=Phyllobacterium phragmitis TaxID=2670329 RepID=A0A2S9INS0_9HYPH|nr:hypothetical protein C5748_17070 [Phyllobacterium phragmitis]
MEVKLEKVQLELAQEGARRIAARAPGDGDYKASIQGDKLSNRQKKSVFGQRASKDTNATGIFAEYIWRWLEFGTGPRTQKTTGRYNGLGPRLPHIFPTWRAFKPKALRKMRRVINQVVKDANW